MKTVINKSIKQEVLESAIDGVVSNNATLYIVFSYNNERANADLIDSSNATVASVSNGDNISIGAALQINKLRYAIAKNDFTGTPPTGEDAAVVAGVDYWLEDDISSYLSSEGYWTNLYAQAYYSDGPATEHMNGTVYNIVSLVLVDPAADPVENVKDFTSNLDLTGASIIAQARPANITVSITESAPFEYLSLIRF